MSSDEESWTRYLGVTGAVEKPTGALKLLLAYTWSRHRGTWRERRASSGLVAGTGYFEDDLDDDRRHAIQALLSYDLHGYASLGTIFTGATGGPATSRLFRNDATAAFENLRGGASPGININDPGDDRSARQPGERRLNLQLRLHAKRLVGLDLDVYCDVINLFDWGAVSYDDPYSFDSSYRLQERRAARLGLAYRY